MITFFDEVLWGQAGGGVGELLGALVFLLLVILQIAKAYFDSRKAKVEETVAEEERKPPKRDKSTERIRPKQDRQQSLQGRGLSAETKAQKRDRNSRGSLSRELAPQGVGERFEAAPGTLDSSQLVSPSIESTVKPTLDSMTGIYEAAPLSSEPGAQPLTLDIQKLIARPEGVRQAVILAEILKRPEY